MRTIAVVLAVVSLMASAPAFAQGAKATSPPEFARLAEHLKPGQWVWAPQVAPKGPLLVYVDLSRQLATVYRNGVGIGVSTVSSGKPGHETPTGVFTILQKDAKHRPSRFYELVKSVVTAGTTILVTNSSVGASEGKRITVMDAVAPKVGT